METITKQKIPFKHIADSLQENFDIIAQLVEITGQRWSFVCGRKLPENVFAVPIRIRINKHTGIILYDTKANNSSKIDYIKESIIKIANRLDNNQQISKEEIIEFLTTKDNDKIETLFFWADVVRRKYVGDDVHIRGIIEFSNYCFKNCLYCGLRRDNKKIHRYKMSIDEIFNTAKKAATLGYKTVVLQSGEAMVYPIKKIAELIKKIKQELNLAITLSLGELEYKDYEILQKAGADRYLMRFETTDRELFKRLKPDSDYDARFKRLYWLKELGFQTGSGIMIGLPGQTPESIADDILMFKKLDLDMVGNGPFIPNPDTPLKDTNGGTLIDALKLVALTRIVTLNAHIPATTALGTISSQGRQKALHCGANVIMPNITPREYRRHYMLYPGKICVDENTSDCNKCINAMVLCAGREISTNFGHSLKK